MEDKFRPDGHHRPNIDVFKAKKALQKLHSIAESIYDDSYILGGLLPSCKGNSLPREHHVVEIPWRSLQSREGPDPEKDDVHLFVKSGEVKGRSENRYRAQDSITFLSSQSISVHVVRVHVDFVDFNDF